MRGGLLEKHEEKRKDTNGERGRSASDSFALHEQIGEGRGRGQEEEIEKSLIHGCELPRQ